MYPTVWGGMVAEPVRVRRLTDQEGQQLQRIVRRGSTSTVRYRCALPLSTKTRTFVADLLRALLVLTKLESSR
ncbi:hypothetical protein ACQPYK_00065 [Streptosporangium sp. CA-135522]|uniref:hypothetical protein n=1 Tax=Streptosporangium sp. CA-135522 TaxID=3240072 RepID=UPI003D925350